MKKMTLIATGDAFITRRFPDRRKNASMTVVTGMIICRIKQIKTKRSHIIKGSWICHCPGSSGKCRRISFLIMECHLQIRKFHIILTDHVSDLLKSLITAFRKS